MGFGDLIVSVAFGASLLLNPGFKKGKDLVASATPEATDTGVKILEKGGNAIDAAVAVAFTLGVTEPAMSGIGGRTMILLSIPNKPPIAIGGHALTPSVLQSDIEKADLTYYKQVAVPSQVKILQYAWKKYGSGKLTWEELLQPAIKYAEDGFIVGKHRHHVFKAMEEFLKESPYHNSELLIDNEIPSVGDLVKQPTLAKTLKRLAKYGGDDFYKGEIAKTIAKDFEENGGWITYEDLASFPDPEESTPLHTTYRGYDVYSFVPPSGGWQVLQALNLLEQVDASKIAKTGKLRSGLIIKALNKSHNDRLDNAIVDYSNYDKEVSKKISKEYAMELWQQQEDAKSKNGKSKASKEGETTHFSIVDKTGMAVSVTSSVGRYFGAFASTKSLGFFYNSYVRSLMGFGLGKSLQPKTRIPSSMSPSLVRKDGENVLVIGTPGSKRIVSTISQLVQLWIDSEDSIQDIIAYPRIHAIRDKVYLEDTDLDHEWLHQLRNDGFKIAFPYYGLTISDRNAYFGGVHAVEFKNGEWKAAADPRRDGKSN